MSCVRLPQCMCLTKNLLRVLCLALHGIMTEEVENFAFNV